MSVQKLKKAPLKEVIFELNWEMASEEDGIPVDTGYEVAVGKLADRLIDLLPLQKRLYPESLPLRILGSPTYQYWKSELQWPVIQHGPGVLTVNDTDENYEWEGAFRPLVIKAIDALLGSYGKVLPFNKAKLRYIDAYDVPEEQLREFAHKNLLTQITVDYEEPGKRTSFNIMQSFDIGNGTEMHLQIYNGKNNQTGHPAIIWTTSVEKKGMFNKDEIMEWLDFAHGKTSVMFRKMLNPDFYASLDQ